MGRLKVKEHVDSVAGKEWLVKGGKAGKFGFDVAKDALKEFSHDKATRWAAAVSYYAVFSLAPLLLIAIAVAGAVFGEQAAQGEVSNQLTNVMGADGAKAIETMLKNAQGGTEGASIVGFVGLIFGASAIFLVLKDAMNQMFEVPDDAVSGIKAIIFQRVISFLLVLLIGALVVASLAMSAILMNLAKITSNILPQTEVLIQMLDFLVLTLLLGLVFGVLIKALPDVKIDWRYALKGGMLTGFLFSIGKFLIALYLAHKSLDSSYGAAGSLVLIMLWVYFSAMIFFLGAEVTYILWRRGQEASAAEASAKEPPDSQKQPLSPRSA